MSDARRILNSLVSDWLSNALVAPLRASAVDKFDEGTSFAWREAAADLALVVTDIVALAHQEGAAVAFGLIGMAQAINEREFWRNMGADDDLIKADSTTEHIAAQGLHRRPVVDVDDLIDMCGTQEGK